MGDLYSFADLERYCSQKESISKVKRGKNADMRTKILKILVVVLFAVLIVEAVIYVVIIPCTASVQVRFAGLTQYAPEDIIKVCGLNVRQTWINFDTGALASKLNRIHLFESVQVEKSFPDQIIITVSERKTAAIAITEINGQSVAVQIDKTGYVYRLDGNIPA
ncbi:MAG: FtsQ-type POTRA domain-containing protein, partial [Treponema sp.]|nr:FtsQ-type POTRA domain-containing protein [Treponema sp.]